MTTDLLSSPPTFSCFLNELVSPPTADGLILSLPMLRKQVVISCSRDVPLQCQYSAITFRFSLTPPNPTSSWFCTIERERAVVLRQHDGWQTRVGPLSGSPPRAPPDGDFNVWRGKRSLGHSPGWKPGESIVKQLCWHTCLLVGLRRGVRNSVKMPAICPCCVFGWCSSGKRGAEQMYLVYCHLRMVECR